MTGVPPSASILLNENPFWGEDVIHMSEEEQAARRALQESMDLRDQGHTDA
jgi:hypothetical protein